MCFCRRSSPLPNQDMWLAHCANMTNLVQVCTDVAHNQPFILCTHFASDSVLCTCALQLDYTDCASRAVQYLELAFECWERWYSYAAVLCFLSLAGAFLGSLELYRKRMQLYRNIYHQHIVPVVSAGRVRKVTLGKHPSSVHSAYCFSRASEVSCPESMPCLRRASHLTCHIIPSCRCATRTCQ